MIDRARRLPGALHSVMNKKAAMKAIETPRGKLMKQLAESDNRKLASGRMSESEWRERGRKRLDRAIRAFGVGPAIELFTGRDWRSYP